MGACKARPKRCAYYTCPSGSFREGVPFETSSRVTHKRGPSLRLPASSGPRSPKLTTASEFA
eukprot:7939957-Pyramimonas_sp.AAC.1